METDDLSTVFKMDEKINHSPFLPEKFYNLETDTVELEPDCKKISETILSKAFSLTTFIEYLDSFLTASTALNRKRGIFILTQVINNLKTEFLNESEIAVLVHFYVERIKDHFLLQSDILDGFCSLVKMENLPEQSGKLILQSLSNIQAETSPTPDRMKIYKFLSSYLDIHTKDAKTLGLDYVNSVIQLTSSERNPTNLLYLFNWLPRFYRNVHMGELTEDCFDIISVYFPIDFQDRDNIAIRDKLANELRNCLCSVPQFGEFSIPLALEKLDTPVKSSILDSCEVLFQGCENIFPPEIYEENIDKIWSLLKQRIFTTTDATIREKSSSTIVKIISYVARNPESIKIIIDILRTEHPINLTASPREFKIAIDIFLQISKINTQFCDYFDNEIVPTILSFNDDLYIMTVLSDFGHIYFQSYNKLPEQMNYAEIILKNLERTEAEYRAVAWESVSKIINGFSVTDKSKNLIIKFSLNAIVNENDLKVREKLNLFMTEFKKYLPDSYNFVVFENNFSESTDLQILNNYLSTLTDISDMELVQKFIKKCFSNNRNVRLSYLKWLSNLKDLSQFEKFIIDDFISSNLKLADVIDFDYEIVLLTGQIVMTMMSVLQFDSDKLQIFNLDSLDNMSERLFTVTICLITPHLLRTKACDEHIFNAVLSRVSSTLDPTLLTICIPILVTLINKFPGNQEVVIPKNSALVMEVDNCEALNLDSLLRSLRRNLEKMDENQIPQYKDNINQIVTWVVKVLAMRADAKYEAETWMKMMFQRLKTDETIAKYFALLLCEDKYLQAEYFNVLVGPLWKQRLFMKSLKHIQALHAEEKKIQYMAAFTNLLIHLPDDLLVLHFAEIRPLLFECLELNNPLLQFNSLNKFEYLVINQKHLVDGLVTDIIAILLKVLKTTSLMDVKYKTLKLLEQLSKFQPSYRILPSSSKVIYGVVDCLNDPKRFIRIQARKTRLAWFQIS